MDKSAVQRYYELKVRHKEMEQEMSELRRQILDWCAENGLTESEIGEYRVRIIAQDRREYDEDKLYKALPDAEVWRLISKADPAKIAGLVKLNVLNEEILQGTYTLKKVTALQVDKI
jgi:integrase